MTFGCKRQKSNSNQIKHKGNLLVHSNQKDAKVCNKKEVQKLEKKGLIGSRNFSSLYSYYHRRLNVSSFQLKMHSRKIAIHMPSYGPSLLLGKEHSVIG